MLSDLDMKGGRIYAFCGADGAVPYCCFQLEA